MTVSRCIGVAMNIQRKPRDEWLSEIEKLGPCEFEGDCTNPAPAETRCQEVAKDYLRVHWRAAK